MKSFLPVFRSVGAVSGNPRHLRSEFELLKEPDPDAIEDWLATLRFTEPFLTEIRGRLESQWAAVPFAATPFYITGQSHVDVAWKWRFSQTIRKTIVTYAKAVWHIRHHPRFAFASSQPVLLDWVRRQDPRLFRSIQAAAKTGRFDLVGGMWLEPDCRIPSGESLVRHRLYGQRFYLKYFGKTSDVEWLPDCFGYASTLPQILLKSGSRYLFTVKLHDQPNPFPYVQFRWQSPDGSQVLTCLNPDLWNTLDRFEATRSRRRLLRAAGSLVADYTLDTPEQSELFSDDLPAICVIMGKGDGGHGPTGEEVAIADRLASDRGVTWISATEYFQSKLERHRARMPIWADELYYEFHRGTLTTQSLVKRVNRYFEWRLCAVEKLASLALMVGCHPSVRWALRFERMWKLVLLNQFHDILPGSSIPEVFDDSLDIWQVARGELDRAEKSAWKLYGGARAGGKGAGGEYILFNATGFDVENVPVEIPLDTGAAPDCVVIDGKPRSVQLVDADPEDGGGAPDRCPRRALILTSAPQHSLTRIRFADFKAPSPEGRLIAHQDGQMVVMENDAYRVAIDRRTGTVKSIFSKDLGLETIDGPGMRLGAFYDWLPEEQCWNILPDYRGHGLDLPDPCAVTIVESGPVRLTLEIVRRFFNGRSTSAANAESTIRHRISLYSDSPGVHMDFLLDWRSCEAILKFDIHTRTAATDVVAEVPYGTDSRRTNPIASHDVARWENFHQTWVDLSAPDGSWGLGVISTGKYGYDAQGGRIGLTLIRGPLYPPTAKESWVNLEREKRFRSSGESVPTHADQGAHRIRYVIVPHRGAWSESSPFLPALAHWLNEGHVVSRSPKNLGKAPFAASLVRCVTNDAEISTLKPAEDGAGFILRIVEVKRRHAVVTVRLHPALGLRHIGEADLLEREISSNVRQIARDHSGILTSFALALRPHEIKTVILRAE